MHIVRCNSACCYLGLETDGQTVYAWEGGEEESLDGYFLLVDGAYLGPTDGNPPFPDERRDAISRFIAAENVEIRRQFTFDYTPMPAHFRELRPTEAKEVLCMFHPYFPHWRISAQLHRATETDPAYRWNRSFFLQAIAQPVPEEYVAAYREEDFRDMWEQYFAVDSTFRQYMQEMDAKERRYAPAEEPSRVWLIEGVDGLVLRKFRRRGDKHESAEYLWIENRRARRIKGPAYDPGNGQIECLQE